MPGRGALETTTKYTLSNQGIDELTETFKAHEGNIACIQSMHLYNAWHSAQGIRSLVIEIRGAPIEPGMPSPQILVVAPPEIQTPKVPIAPKFLGAEAKCAGLVSKYRNVTAELGCHFFDAGEVTTTSKIDGVHLDADKHQILGKALVDVVYKILKTTSNKQ